MFWIASARASTRTSTTSTGIRSCTAFLNEAPFFVPEVHGAWLERMSSGYQRSLRRGMQQGQLPDYRPEELEALSYMLMGAREYLLERYCAKGDRVEPLPPEVRDTYLKFAALALGHGAAVERETGSDEPGGDG